MAAREEAKGRSVLRGHGAQSSRTHRYRNASIADGDALAARIGAAFEAARPDHDALDAAGDALDAGSGMLVLGRNAALAFDQSIPQGSAGAGSTGLFGRLSRLEFFRESLFVPDILPVAIGVWLPCLWTFIDLVSAVDTYLSAKYPDFLKALEINPVGRMLIQMDGGDPALLLGTKFFCNLLVFSILILSHRWYSRLCWVLTVASSLLQLWLLGFLLFA